MPYRDERADLEMLRVGAVRVSVALAALLVLEAFVTTEPRYRTGQDRTVIRYTKLISASPG